MPYSPLLVKPMREELTMIGFEELTTGELVDQWSGAKEGTGLLVINSVCGCAAGMARPGIRLALEQSEKKPDHIATVFAGQDQEATAQARGLFPQVPPSSPSMAFFKDGELAGRDGLNNPYNMLTQRGWKKTTGNTLRANLTINQDFSFITPGLSAKVS